ncbi:exosortase/archaeosortase family protein [Haloferula chungangensis]|uniref:Exosortase/archaeosortase family protein n=1 Tax=Haloferula chungangensis TaxID=1048331 RepID=A0ABW2L8X4_9BACT
MSPPPAAIDEKGRTIFGLIFIAILWLQLCFVLIPSWEGGTYYDYGWLVPPAIAFLAYQRWQDVLPPQPAPKHQAWLKILIFLGVLSIIPIRVIEHVDALWRFPLWAHAFVMLGITHLSLVLLKGWRRSLHLAPATFMILVAVPLPTSVQSALVEALTGFILDLSSQVLPMMGFPAILSGTAFVVDGKLLDVTEGCSGIRSFQSCITAALVLGELSRFKIPTRLFLLIASLAIAIIANTIRIVTLTQIAYTEGHDAMDKAHDPVGLWTAVATYVLVAGLAWLISAWSTHGKKVKVVRKKVANSA